MRTGLYHGTRAGFGPGGYLLPGDQVGKDNFKMGRSHVVYITPDLEWAKVWAEHSQGRGKPKVLEVAPCSELGVDDSTVAGDEHEAYTCDMAKVLRVVWKGE
jgi:hypothetical protein